MEKYCTSCGRVLGDVDFSLCPYCGEQLSEREGRQSIPDRIRHEVFKRDGYRCRECGASLEEGATLEIDHIIPVANGGTNDIDNLQTLCKKCNRGKYTDEWIGGETDLKVAKNEYIRLSELKQEYEEKLSIATNNEDIIDFKYQIIRINERLENVSDKIQKLHMEQEELEKQQKENEKRDKLFKKLYISLSDVQLQSFMYMFPDVGESREEIIKYLVNNYSESQINDLIIQMSEALEKAIEKTNELVDKLNEQLSNSQINIIKNIDYEIPSTKIEIINYLVSNFSEEEIDDIINKIKRLPLLEKKNLDSFCLVKCSDLYLYYYKISTGKYGRFYDGSEDKLKQKVLSEGFPWIFEEELISDNSKYNNFIKKFSSKYNIGNIVNYSLGTTFLQSADLIKKVLPLLDPISSGGFSAHGYHFCDCGNKIKYYDRYCSECKPPDELFKIPAVSKPQPKFKKCPNCGAEVRENALRCKYCKTMLK
ncbi:MAG: hypothetical protein E7Z85_09340 [Methanosphaera stadtmanae]|nr:hypothetical protein [Methanosphaera stadtmanae]